MQFGVEFEHVTVTVDTLQTFKIKGSKIKVTARRNASAVKTL